MTVLYPKRVNTIFGVPRFGVHKNELCYKGIML